VLVPLRVAIPLESLESFAGTGDDEFIDGLEKIIGRPFPLGFIEEVRVQVELAFVKDLKPVPGIIELLAKVAGVDIPMCVASNSSVDEMTFKLGCTNLLPYFEGRLFSARDVPRLKPSPDIYLRAAVQMRVEVNIA